MLLSLEISWDIFSYIFLLSLYLTKYLRTKNNCNGTFVVVSSANAHMTVPFTAVKGSVFFFFFVLLTEEWCQYIKQLPTASFKYLTISNTNHHHHHRQYSITRQKIEHQIPYLSTSGMGCVKSKLSPYFLGGLMNERNDRESEQTALCRNVQLRGVYSV